MLTLPADFTPPRQACLPHFRLEALSPDHAEADHQAVCRSANAIRHVFGPQNHWPPTNISFDENLADLRRHLAEFEQRQAFAYCLLTPDGKHYLGCLYLKPIKSRLENDWRKQSFQAQAFLWLSLGDNPLQEEQTLASLQNWLSRHWPLASIAWPGRAPGWDAWLSATPTQHAAKNASDAD